MKQGFVTYSFLLLSLLVLFTGCRPPSGNSSTTVPENVKVQVEVGDNPMTGNVPVSVFILKDDQGVSGATIEVTANMTHAGMEPVIVTAKESGAGLYTADPFVIEMPGDTVVTTEVTLSDGTKFSVDKAFTVAQTP
jgi:YtkA-like